MKFHPLPFLFIIILAGCSHSPSQQNTVSTTDTTIVTNATTKTEQPHQNANIFGVWSADEEQPTFEIKKDSVYYIDSDKSFKYNIVDSIITIFFDDYTYSGVIKLKDQKTLIIRDSLNINTYIREEE